MRLFKSTSSMQLGYLSQRHVVFVWCRLCTMCLKEIVDFSLCHSIFVIYELHEQYTIEKVKTTVYRPLNCKAHQPLSVSLSVYFPFIGFYLFIVVFGDWLLFIHRQTHAHTHTHIKQSYDSTRMYFQGEFRSESYLCKKRILTNPFHRIPTTF